MRKVVPSVLTSDPAELEMKIRILERFADVIQIDIMDNQLVPNISIGVEDVQKINTEASLEMHLMVKYPVKYIEPFARAGAFRAIFHVECDDDVVDVIEEIKRFDMQPGIALNPPTPVEEIIPFLESVDVVLVMGVNPGFQGQKFIPEVLSKVKIVKEIRPEIIVEVDGGVNSETGSALVDAGVDILNVGSYLFKKPPVENNWEQMQKIIHRG